MVLMSREGGGNVAAQEWWLGGRTVKEALWKRDGRERLRGVDL